MVDAEPYETSRIYTLQSGDGTKTVYVRFIDGGDPGTPSSDTIVLDTTPPDEPTDLSATSSISGSDKTVVLSWSPPFPSPADLAGYQVWKRKTTSTTWQQVTSYVGHDLFGHVQEAGQLRVLRRGRRPGRGNVSTESNHVTM